MTKIELDFFTAVNKSVVDKKPEIWKKFLPNDSLVKLIKTTTNVLERKQNRNIWVEGAYGVGKSSAVYTLKKLIDSSEKETRAYFKKHNLHNDLCNRLQAVKSSGRILTVHHYGAVSIRSNIDLAFAVQESIREALFTAGIEKKAVETMRDSIIDLLSKNSRKNHFNALITRKYSNLFNGDNADDVIKKLRTFSSNTLHSVIYNISKIDDYCLQKIISDSVSDLNNWIRKVIHDNGLNAILFIWDEFDEYFHNNDRNLTAFQELCELSETDPFYFVLVTHSTKSFLHWRKNDFIKLNKRFVNPHVSISMPEEIAIKFIREAMDENRDNACIEDYDIAISAIENSAMEGVAHAISRPIYEMLLRETKNDAKRLTPNSDETSP